MNKIYRHVTQEEVIVWGGGGKMLQCIIFAGHRSKLLTHVPVKR